MTEKYTSEDRKKVIEELEKIQKTKLIQVKPYKDLKTDVNKKLDRVLKQMFE